MNALHTAALNVIPVTRASGTADDHNIPGWNDIFKAAHSDARDAFKFWVRSSKPRHGEVDSTLFWKHVSKQNNDSLKLADTVLAVPLMCKTPLISSLANVTCLLIMTLSLP